MFLSFIISALLIARAHPSPTPTPTPTPPPENTAITAIARHEFVALQAGAVDKSHYADAAAAELTPDTTEKMSKMLSSYGALVHVEWVGTFPLVGAPAGAIGYTYKMDCTNAPVYEQLMIGADGKIYSVNFLKKLPD